MSESISSKDLQPIVEEVEAATAALLKAQQKASYANLEETSAINRLNKAQGALDAYVQRLRNQAPSQSDWRKGR